MHRKDADILQLRTVVNDLERQVSKEQQLQRQRLERATHEAQHHKENSAVLAQDNANLRDQCQRLGKDNSALRQAYTEATGQIQALLSDFDGVKRENDRLREENARLQDALRESEAHLARALADQRDREGHLGEVEQEINTLQAAVDRYHEYSQEWGAW